MAIPKHVSANFKTLHDAFTADSVALMECKNAETGAIEYLICAVNQGEGEAIEFAPFARMIDGNPYDMFLPPDPNSETGGYLGDKN